MRIWRAEIFRELLTGHKAAMKITPDSSLEADPAHKKHASARLLDACAPESTTDKENCPKTVMDNISLNGSLPGIFFADKY
jgi:hypothetical protein